MGNKRRKKTRGVCVRMDMFLLGMIAGVILLSAVMLWLWFLQGVLMAYGRYKTDKEIENQKRVLMGYNPK